MKLDKEKMRRGWRGVVLLLLASHDEGVLILDVVRVPLRDLLADQLLAQDFVRLAISGWVEDVPKDSGTRLRHSLQRCRRQQPLQPSQTHRTPLSLSSTIEKILFVLKVITGLGLKVHYKRHIKWAVTCKFVLFPIFFLKISNMRKKMSPNV